MGKFHLVNVWSMCASLIVKRMNACPHHPLVPQPAEAATEDKKKGKAEKVKKCIRTAAGTTWEDQSMLEWETGNVCNLSINTCIPLNRWIYRFRPCPHGWKQSFSLLFSFDVFQEYLVRLVAKTHRAVVHIQGHCVALVSTKKSGTHQACVHQACIQTYSRGGESGCLTFLDWQK